MTAFIEKSWEIWDVASSLWSLLAALATAGLWAIARSERYQEWRLRRDTAALFYKHRRLFVETELSYSIPAFVQNTEAMTLREWAYHALVPPGLLFNRDWMEYITIINRARQLINATLESPDADRRREAYRQLAPRFDQLCAELNSMRDRYRDCPGQFHQAYLWRPPVIVMAGDEARTR